MTGRVDSEGWTCRGCHVEHIGRRPADDVCGSCVVEAITTEPGQAIGTTAPAGPFETADEARELPEVRAIYRNWTPGHHLADGARQLLRQALDDAGVSLGAYDRALTAWMGGFEPQVVSVIASWVTRARVVSSRLEAIRSVLADFDPETGDAAAVLDLVDQIASTSRTASSIEAGGSASLLPADVATVLDALDVAAERKRDLAAGCPDCPQTVGGPCETRDRRLRVAKEYNALVAKLGGDR